MNKRILLISYFFLCTIWAYSQATYVKTLGASGHDIINAAINTKDGNYLVFGSTTSFGSGGRDGYLAKLNVSGKEIWDKSIGTEDVENYEGGVQLANGDFILVGWGTGSDFNGKYILVTRLDNFGGVIWNRTFDGLDQDQGYSAIETSDGNILIVGESENIDDSTVDLVLIKLTLNGQDIWSKKIDTNKEWILDPEIIEDGQGNYLLSAAYYDNNNPGMDGAIFNIDSFGNHLSSKIYRIPGESSYINYLSDNGSGFQNFGQVTYSNVNEKDIILTDFASNGDVNWSKTFGVVGVGLYLRQVTKKANGNYLLTGQLEQLNPDSTIALRNGFLTEITTNGDVLWSKSFGASGLESLDAVFETSNGTIAFGQTLFSYVLENLVDVLVVRTNEFGSVSGCSEPFEIVVNDVTPIPEQFVPNVLDFSSGNPIELNVTNINFEEEVICDGCDADDLVAGLFCETAPIICSIDCLDGFTATLPNDLIMPQPDPLCDGGIPNNVSWFAFVAGSNTIDLSIIPTNCTTIFDDTGTTPQTIGIQAGVYADCNFEESFICQTDGCLDLVAETVNIASDQFEIGQVYYLFVDGCGGSICDYEVVVNSAEQAFAMPEITTISNNLNIDLDTDTLCQGTEIEFTLDDFDLSVEFNWAIDPPTSLYPSGVHPVTDSNSVSFIFDEEGCFDIHVYAFNDCDNTETRTFSVCVEALENEMFSEITVCQECFPITLVSPDSGCIITEGGGPPTVLTEDPNGDGVPGWLGTSTIMGPGLDSNIVVNGFGCTYVQYVNVVEIPLPPRAQIDEYFCLTDFPVTINGQVFNSPGDSRNITLDGEAASGCDSLINITAHGIDLFGVSNIGNCESGEVELAFVINNVVPETYDSITYTWYDENGDNVLDVNGVDSVLLVTGVGSYSVQATVHVFGISCSQSFGPYMIDIDNLAPVIPNVTYAPNEICDSELQTQIYVANQGLGENYMWTLTPNLPITFGATTDTIFVDVMSGQNFEFCVLAVNGCGISPEFCDNVIVNESPDSEFSFNEEICIDSFVMIEYTGAFGNASSSVFNWDFDGGSILNGMDPNSGGPFEIGFSSSGNYTIGLILEEDGCSSINTEHQVTVVDPFIAPSIDCESEAGFVTFSWDNTGVIDVAVTVVSGQTDFEQFDNSIIINGLSSEEEVTIQIDFNADTSCGSTIVIENCASMPCPDVTLDISLSENDICNDSNSDIDLSIDIIGDNSGQGSWIGPFVFDDDKFDISEAGIGTHIVTYQYVINDCIYENDTSISIFDIPSADIEIFPSYCDDMGSNLVNIITDSNNTIQIDGNTVNTLNDIEVETGDHLVNVTTIEGCMTEIEFTVGDLSVTDLLISGNNSIIEGSAEDYTASYISTLNDLVLIWTLDGDTLCVNCETVTISPEMDSELCVHIDYGEGCQIEDCLLVEISQRTKFHMPNAFSPNNDNINDIFTLNSNNNNAFIIQFKVFNRWGEMVYNQQSFNVGEEANFWDGTYNGQMCQPGVYVYILDYFDENEEEQRITGDLTLVR